MKPVKHELVGVDVFLYWDKSHRNPDVLGKKLAEASAGAFDLTLITNRGVKVYPEGLPETFCTDHWRCRFKSSAPDIPYQAVLELMHNINNAGLDIIKTENLCTFDGKPGFSLGQGE